MSIASELQNYADGLGDAYDAVNDMNGILPAQKNMNNLDAAIRTIPQPTVNDGTLTIQQNGTQVATFTANQASNATANITVPTDTSDLTNTAGFITSASLPGDMTGATSGTAGAHGLAPAPSAGDEGKVLHGDGTWKDATAKLVEMSYGESNAWAKFIAAYNAGSIVYCRASSNANPGTGSQTRKAFMAYVNNATSPTSVEFQYVRSVSSKTSSQPVDQVFVYTLTNASGGTWSVVTRDMGPKTAAGTGIGVNYSGGTYTISANAMTGATSSAAGAAGIVPAPAAGDDTKFLAGDGTWKTAGGGGTVTYYIADGDPNYPAPLQNNFVYEDSARTVAASAGDVYADMQAGKTVFLEYRTGMNTGSDMRTTVYTLSTMTERQNTYASDQYDYYGSMTAYMDSSSTTTPATVGFRVEGAEPRAWIFQVTTPPSVYNGTLTIQKNGTNVQTFTANSSTNKTANITVPTALSELTGTASTSQIADGAVTSSKIDWSSMASYSNITSTSVSLSANTEAVINTLTVTNPGTYLLIASARTGNSDNLTLFRIRQGTTVSGTELQSQTGHGPYLQFATVFAIATIQSQTSFCLTARPNGATQTRDENALIALRIG